MRQAVVTGLSLLSPWVISSPVRVGLWWKTWHCDRFFIEYSGFSSQCWDWDSVVGVVTSYRLVNLGFKPWWGQESFFVPVQLCHVGHPVFCAVDTVGQAVRAWR
jgi:hypothetical protein